MLSMCSNDSLVESHERDFKGHLDPKLQCSIYVCLRQERRTLPIMYKALRSKALQVDAMALASFDPYSDEVALRRPDASSRCVKSF